MHLTERRIGNALVLAASGRIDHASAEDFKTALQPHLLQCKTGGDVVVLDFSGVQYISSVGLRVLMVAAKALRARKAAIAVASLQPVVAEIFEISRFHHVVDVRGNLRNAIGAISPQALAAYDRTAERT